MNPADIFAKYGNASYEVDQDTFHMGIYHVLGEHVAQRFTKGSVVLDACAGAGFMAIALAQQGMKVIAVDIDTKHLAQARANATIASVGDNITFIEGNVLEIVKGMTFDAAFLDPDWARPGMDKAIHVQELSDMEPSGQLLFDEVQKVSPNICFRLPKEFDIKKVQHLPPHEVQRVYQDNKLKFLCAYFGSLMVQEGETELRCDSYSPLTNPLKYSF
jgi:16S rRNA G966 N2-methylase RsmD